MAVCEYRTEIEVRHVIQMSVCMGYTRVVYVLMHIIVRHVVVI